MHLLDVRRKHLSTCDYGLENAEGLMVRLITQDLGRIFRDEDLSVAQRAHNILRQR